MSVLLVIVACGAVLVYLFAKGLLTLRVRLGNEVDNVENDDTAVE